MTWAPVDTLSNSLAQLEGEPFGHKLALVLAKVVINKLSDSLAELIVKKLATLGARKRQRGW